MVARDVQGDIVQTAAGVALQDDARFLVHVVGPEVLAGRELDIAQQRPIPSRIRILLDP